MKQVLIHKGQALVKEVPAPKVGSGEVLVQVHTSCLSVGTELSGVRSSAVPLWKKALKQPEKVASTLKMIGSQGLQRTLSLLEEKREAAFPTGYSATGVVIAVGTDIHDIKTGDRVACAGAQCAHHAEFIRVPRNLCVVLPETVDWESASSITLGAIALQGVRRATPTLGECFVVLGLGILGQLTVQLLKANGCQTIGLDLDEERIALALGLGMTEGYHPNQEDVIQRIMRLTDGMGADGVIITAASSSDTVISLAFKACRKKGRVVLVGDVGLNLNRSDFYVKEIDFFISSSYGPGRYDYRYEEQGLDYPVAYVRWTENRNMKAYVELLANQQLRISPLISATYPVTDATDAYASLGDPNKKSMMVLLTYPTDTKLSHQVYCAPKNSRPRQDTIRLAVVGTGAFARSAHLPLLQSLKKTFTLQAVVNRTGHVANAVAKQFGAHYCSTDFDAVLNDPKVDAVLIATRHHLHNHQVLEALKAGKHVLVEKPLAMSHDELMTIDQWITQSTESLPVLLTGYNRRFSPYANQLHEWLKKRTNPFIINYRMNAGFIPLDHWVHGLEGGGRNIGEACHIYDLFTYLADAEVKNIQAMAISPQTGHYSRRDNFVATLRFADGSVASLTYTALGHHEHPKEMAEIYVDGQVAVLSDYKSLTVHGAKKHSLKTRIQEKGLKEELVAFARAIKQKSGQWPIPWWQQMQTAQISFLVEDAMRNNPNNDEE